MMCTSVFVSPNLTDNLKYEVRVAKGDINEYW